MALPALAEAMKVFGEEVPFVGPSASSPRSTDPGAEIVRQAQIWERHAAALRPKLIISRNKVRDSLRFLNDNGAIKPDDFQVLSAAIASASANISLLKAKIDVAKSEIAETISKITIISPEKGKFARKAAERALKAICDIHDQHVEFYYFLMAIRADLDPRSRGGPSFSDPDELERYLLDAVRRR